MVFYWLAAAAGLILWASTAPGQVAVLEVVAAFVTYQEERQRGQPSP